MKYKIQSGIPVQTKKSRTKQKSELRIAIESLEPGQCVDVQEIEKRKGIITVWAVRKSTRMSLTYRSTDFGIRIWRTK